MLFATTTLAARIERAECGLLADSARAVAEARPGANPVVRPLAGGVAIYAGEDSPLNKVAGLGFEGSVDEAELQQIEHLYAERKAPVQVELSCLADPSVGILLTGRGYALVGFENVLGRTLSADTLPLPSEVPDITVAVSEDQDFEAWLNTVVTGFASPDEQGVPSHESFPREALEEAISDMARADGLVRYLALREGALAGGGSMRLGDGIAQLCGAATLPAHRRRGVQTALLTRRLADAASAGCDVAVVTTLPGSKSQENVQRRGFEVLYTRAILVLADPGS
jgi:ribosomal protein S18 acetylase RimI-like enzyme